MANDKLLGSTFDEIDAAASVTSDNCNKGHSIFDFADKIKKLPNGKYKIDNGQIVKMNSLNNPIKLVSAWFLGSIAVTLLLVLITGVSTSGGEQLPLVIVAKAMIVMPTGGLILSLVSPFFTKPGAKSIGIW